MALSYNTTFSVLKKHAKNIDVIMIILFMILATIGLTTLYFMKQDTHNFWFHNHMIRLAIGFTLMIIIALFGLALWRFLSYIAYIICLMMLVYVELKGHIGLGAQRWISLGFINIQPSEFMKVSLIMCLAKYYSDIGWSNAFLLRYQFIPCVLIAIPVILVLRQPDLGTAILLTIVGISVMFLAGASWWFFASCGALSISALYPAWFFILKDYQKKRIMTFLDPSQDTAGAGYHIDQSIIAIGSGSVWGKGLGQGPQAQLSFLPEKHTDFIFTVIAEETGFIGSLCVILIHLCIVLYGFFKASSITDTYAKLIASGFIIYFATYFLVNIGMIMGLLPVVGVPLPLISYGGSSILAVMAGLGLYLTANTNHKLLNHRS